MKVVIALFKREWQEWRGVMLIVLVLYVLGCMVTAVAYYKGAAALPEDPDLDQLHFLWKDHGDDGVAEWLSPGEMAAAGVGGVILFGWSHFLRVGVTSIFVSFLFLALFYLSDAVFKERADASTLFYRSLPVRDDVLLGVKFLTGTAGFMAVSFILGVIWVLFAQITFPGNVAALMEGTGYSVWQLGTLDFIGDWFTFHLLTILWLAPYAAYLLFISTVSRSRPLLFAIAIPILLGVLWRYLAGDNALLATFLTNNSQLGHVLKTEWLRNGRLFHPDETIGLFGSFGSYVLSVRSLISLVIAGGFFTGAFWAYRKNLPIS